jgi:hypothetical protein
MKESTTARPRRIIYQSGQRSPQKGGAAASSLTSPDTVARALNALMSELADATPATGWHSAGAAPQDTRLARLRAFSTFLGELNAGAQRSLAARRGAWRRAPTKRTTRLSHHCHSRELAGPRQPFASNMPVRIIATSSCCAMDSVPRSRRSAVCADGGLMGEETSRAAYDLLGMLRARGAPSAALEGAIATVEAELQAMCVPSSEATHRECSASCRHATRC